MSTYALARRLLVVGCRWEETLLRGVPSAWPSSVCAPQRAFSSSSSPIPPFWSPKPAGKRPQPRLRSSKDTIRLTKVQVHAAACCFSGTLEWWERGGAGGGMR